MELASSGTEREVAAASVSTIARGEGKGLAPGPTPSGRISVRSWLDRSSLRSAPQRVESRLRLGRQSRTARRTWCRRVAGEGSCLGGDRLRVTGEACLAPNQGNPRRFGVSGNPPGNHFGFGQGGDPLRLRTSLVSAAIGKAQRGTASRPGDGSPDWDSGGWWRHQPPFYWIRSIGDSTRRVSPKAASGRLIRSPPCSATRPQPRPATRSSWPIGSVQCRADELA